jgi:DNA-binding NarL/FixJ family response regulator
MDIVRDLMEGQPADVMSKGGRCMTLALQSVSAATTVLIIDDNEEDLKQWTGALTSSSSNYAVLESSSAQSGLGLCRENAIDCVLLDLDMPVSGFHALLELIPDRTRPRIAVIILTRLNHPNLFAMAIHNGAQACLLKQRISAKDLDTAIQQAIAAVKSKNEDAGGASGRSDLV